MFTVGSCYQAAASEDVTEDASVCVIVKCKVQSRTEPNSPINLITNRNSIYSHTHTRDNIYNAYSKECKCYEN